jgi:hypothetical protein
MVVLCDQKNQRECAAGTRVVRCATRSNRTEQMNNPLQPIQDAKAEIEIRQKRRQNIQLDFRGAAAAETIADELTLMRAEMTVMRELLAMIAAS